MAVDRPVSHRQIFLVFAAVGLLWLAAFALRLTAPSDLMDDDQERPAAYVLDVLQNHHWAVQRDQEGDIASKPPMLTWLAALTSLAAGRATRVTIALPNALAALALAWLLLAIGARYFGFSSGLWAALLYLLCPLGFKQLALIRTDPLFTLAIFGAAMLAFRAWQIGRGWSWFWLVAALGTLTKGPLAVLLALLGLVAIFWERRASASAETRVRFSLRRFLLPGLPLYLLIAGGWLALACRSMGYAVIKKMIFGELLGHAMQTEAGVRPGANFYQSTLFFVAGFAPWFVLTLVGLWRIWRHPAAEELPRRFERFLFCLFLPGLLVFSLSSHQRSVLVLPLIPAAALLAGREMAHWRWGDFARRATVAGAIGLAAIWLLWEIVYCNAIRPHKEQVAQTQGAVAMARMIRAKVGANFPLIFTDSPYALQFYLDSMHPKQLRKTAIAAMDGGYTAYFAVSNVDKFHAALDEKAATIHELWRWPKDGKPSLALLSNALVLQWSDQMAVYDGPVLVQLKGARLREFRDGEIVVQQTKPANAITLKNTAADEQKIVVREWQGKSAEPEKVILLAPGQTQTILL